MDILTESSGVDSSPELNSSFEMPVSRRQLAELQVSAPITPQRVQPRKLVFNISPDINSDATGATDAKIPSVVLDESFISPAKTDRSKEAVRENNNENMLMSPPYRKVKALRLFDSPATPKTIIQKSTSSQVKSSSKMMKFLFTNNNVSLPAELRKDEQKQNAQNKIFPSTRENCDRTSAIHSSAFPMHMRANLNPFTPPSFTMRPKKRLRNEMDLNNSAPVYTFGASKSFLRETVSPYRPAETLEVTLMEEIFEVKQAAKRIALQETNISRYEKEFLELELIGSGEFGNVFRCLNRLDGCIYAVKKSIKPVAGSAYE